MGVSSGVTTDPVARADGDRSACLTSKDRT